jgi:hypothetical protein
MKRRPRDHNEWFRPVSLGGRKSCPECGAALAPGESVWSWGEYVRAKWRTVAHFCKDCYQDRVRKLLLDHQRGCGCGVSLVAYGGGRLPDWLTP